ncbi:MAG: sporulation protein YunB [Oscillospiraceae bacterium]|nr:sporulation protein YunB [Oscillospiraceae bacterium]
MAKRRTFWNKLGLKLIALALILIGAFMVTEASFRPMIETINAYECHKVVSTIINDAVLAELDRIGADYPSLVTLSENSAGDVTSVQSNVININRLKTNIANRVEREIERLSAVNIQIPIGTLLGLQLLHGKGFNVGMSVVPLGYANTTIISEFTDAGINQTLHRIIIEISVDVDALIPGYETRVPVKTSIVAAETVIVGKVPDAYTHVITESGELAGTLNDYGAVIN